IIRAVAAKGAARLCPGGRVEILLAIAEQKSVLDQGSTGAQSAALGLGREELVEAQCAGVNLRAALDGNRLAEHALRIEHRRAGGAELVQAREIVAKKWDGQRHAIADVAAVAGETVTIVEEEASAPTDERTHAPGGENAEGQRDFAPHLLD